MVRMVRKADGKMVLANRDTNKMVRKGQPDSKRKRVEIDLTASDNEADDDLDKPQAKVSRRMSAEEVSDFLSSCPQVARKKSSTPASGKNKKTTAAPPAYQTPPASSASSFATSSSPSSSGYGTLSHSQAERNAWLTQGEVDDVNEIMESSQDAGEGSENLQLYGNLATKIVGVQYYRGLANPGEHILIRREPGNPYDSNAIRVDNVRGQQIGHIPRTVAGKLARYLDSRELHVEGVLAGNVGTFDCPLTVRLFGPAADSLAGRDLQTKLKADKLPTKAILEQEREEKRREKERQAAEKKRLTDARKAAAAQGRGNGRIPVNSSQSGFTNQSQPNGESSQPVMDDIVEASQRFNPREISQTAEKFGLAEEALANMPMANKPERISTKMLPYQLQALKWLLDQESPQPPARGSKDVVQLWKRHGSNPNHFTNVATNFSVQDTPPLASGGILADDMGLGKTLEMIALLVADAEKSGARAGSTLVVAPLSVMSNWIDQIARHVDKKKPLSVYKYHAAGRKPMKAADFAEYDVVITTYQTLASDYMPKGKAMPGRELRASGLYSVNWRRIILDEGHIIRNPKAKGAAAVTAVAAKSRWVLTGTPIINSLKDLYSLLRFIGVSGGLEQLELFNSVLVRPLKAGDESATVLLQAIMTAFSLRRKKEMRFIDLKLPELTEYVHRIKFTDKEQQRYDALDAQAKGLLKTYEEARKGKGVSAAYHHLLEILLRMRQCCNHWQLCGERITNLLAQLEKQKTVALTPENTKALQAMLQVSIESQEDCAICLETLHNPVITNCAHAFGGECISKVIESQHKCPMCRAELKDETCLVQPANDCGDDSADDEMDLTASSSKLEALLKILNASKNTGNKTVIFSQWTRYLDIVQSRLDSEGFKYCRIDGTMKASQRDESLHALEDDDDCTIMLASLNVCAVGLNLVAANQIVLSDSWWAPAIEDQAVDRVHRLGQKKKTTVFRLVMDGSIEDRTLEIQAEKRKLMMMAFQERSSKKDPQKGARIADIAKLLK